MVGWLAGLVGWLGWVSRADSDGCDGCDMGVDWVKGVVIMGRYTVHRWY